MNCFKIEDQPVRVALGLISERTLRVSVLPEGETVRETFSTIDLDNRVWKEPSISVAGSYEKSTLETGDFSIVLDAERFTVDISYKGRAVQKLAFDQAGDVTFPLGSGPIFGMGHGYKKHMDRRGGVYNLKVNGQVRGIIENYGATSPTPLVISTDGWALYFHQPWKCTVSLEGDNGAFIKNPMEPKAYADIFVIACDEPMDAAREYYRFTGCPPMLPKYAFGFQQSYRTLKHGGVNYAFKTAEYMREKEIPCDMLIYLGSGYCEYGWNTDNGVFEFHPEVFADPRNDMEKLHKMNYKIALHITKCYTGLHGSIHDKGVSPMEYDHARNYWDKHIKLHEIAQNEAWWPDDADEVDMEQRLARWRMYYEGQLELSPDVRPFQMQRNTFPGANKFGGVIWTGDVNAEWETLKNQIPIGLNAALSASPYWGTDTGGFFCTPEFDGELFMRWFAFSAFTPFIRAHGRPSFLHNPWGFGMFGSLDEIPLEGAPGIKNDGPPRDGTLPDSRVEPFCKDMLKVRYELLPYIYSLSREACGGIPMMRPLWYYFSDDPSAVAVDSQYMLGESMMVAPVVEKGAQSKDVYFPDGGWYSFWTGEKVTGGGVRNVPAPLGIIPVYVRAGGMIAKGPAVQYVDTADKDDFDPLTLYVYEGSDGQYTLYEDDGKSLGYLRGECTTTDFTWNDTTKELNAVGCSTIFTEKTREISVIIMPENKKCSLKIHYEPH